MSDNGVELTKYETNKPSWQDDSEAAETAPPTGKEPQVEAQSAEADEPADVPNEPDPMPKEEGREEAAEPSAAISERDPEVQVAKKGTWVRLQYSRVFVCSFRDVVLKFTLPVWVDLDLASYNSQYPCASDSIHNP